MDSNTNSSNERPRLRKRILIPAIVLALFLVLLIVGVVRGTWADATPRNPSSSAEGCVTQLLAMSDGRKQTRAAMVMDFPMTKVWSVVTDYNRFTDIFPILQESKSEPAADNKHRLSSKVHSPVADWNFDVLITHTVAADQCSASWDQPGGDLTVNRGSWTLTPLGADKTLAVYALEIEVKGFPAFAVRDVLLSQQKVAPVSVDKWLKKTSAK